jgi:hypothetical protein
MTPDLLFSSREWRPSILACLPSRLGLANIGKPGKPLCMLAGILPGHG